MAMVQTRSDLVLVIKDDLDILGRLSCGHAQDHDTNVLNKTSAIAGLRYCIVFAAGMTRDTQDNASSLYLWWSSMIRQSRQDFMLDDILLQSVMFIIIPRLTVQGEVKTGQTLQEVEATQFHRQAHVFVRTGP